ncbi:hypothetical protein [Clavibacter michiganensis]|uniref:hypothetical protein n=2 Tax=Clavibacter michiganensis TaxID=28447 RepID=UPI00142F7FC0|nr:hypothetical protein [Clavibacter michiganensis]QIT13012.1 hypothetical protein GRD74_15615 [Clavibacter michiganensis subsp. michiganensis]QIT16172.1 hypothetical protein GRD61_15795 [Clavibacter michiganensis subsp. michiganensis]
MSTIDRSPADLAAALTFGVAGDDEAAHAARSAAAQDALSGHSEQMDEAYASSVGLRDPWTAAPFGAELVAAAGGDLAAVVASPGFVPEVQREMGLASHEELVDDEDGARYVLFLPSAVHVDAAYDEAREITAGLIQAGNAAPTASVGQGRTVDGALLLTEQQRSTLSAAAREAGRAVGEAAAGRFLGVVYHLEQYSQLPTCPRTRESLEIVLEGQHWIPGAHDLPAHLRDVVADMTPHASRPDSTDARSTQGNARARSSESVARPAPVGYSSRELAEREMLRAAGIDPNERAAQPVASSQAMILQLEVQRSRGDDSLAR